MTLELLLAIMAGLIVLLCLVVFSVFFSRYQKPEVEQAIIRTGLGGPAVALGHGILVLPGLHKSDIVDLRIKRVGVTATVICDGGSQADLKACFYFRIMPLKESILQVVKALGCHVASDEETLGTFFEPKFRDALVRAAGMLTFEALANDREAVLTSILDILGEDLIGFCFEDVAIEYCAASECVAQPRWYTS